MPDISPAVVPVEGEWTSYAQEWDITLTAWGGGGTGVTLIIFDEDSDTVYFMADTGSFQARKLSDGTSKISQTSVSQSSSTVLAVSNRSVRSRYVVFFVTVAGDSNARVFKDGVLLGTFAPSPALAATGQIAISPSGRFVLVTTTGGSPRVVAFKGS